MGRPSIFTQALADLICERIAEGESLRKICSGDEMPARTTVKRWIVEDKAFQAQYARAREERADYYVDRMLDEAESSEGLDAPGVAAKRLIVDTLKWTASKLDAKKYGDKVENTLRGDKEAPLVHEHKLTPEMTREEWLAAHGIALNK